MPCQLDRCLSRKSSRSVAATPASASAHASRPASDSSAHASPLASSLTSSPSETEARRVERMLDAEARGWGGGGAVSGSPLQIASPDLLLLLDAVHAIPAEIVSAIPQPERGQPTPRPANLF
eukprot:2930897-Rhodomonas_salina.1